jgi:hypothetical protein
VDLIKMKVKRNKNKTERDEYCIKLGEGPQSAGIFVAPTHTLE